LGVSTARGKKQNSQQSNIFQITHNVPSIPDRLRGVKRRARRASRRISLGKRLTVG
jgi:hypothetical protein